MTEPIDLDAYRNKRLPRARFITGEVRLVQLYRDGQPEPGMVGLCLPIDDEDIPGVRMSAHECRSLAASLLRVADMIDREIEAKP